MSKPATPPAASTPPPVPDSTTAALIRRPIPGFDAACLIKLADEFESLKGELEKAGKLKNTLEAEKEQISAGLGDLKIEHLATTGEGSELPELDRLYVIESRLQLLPRAQARLRERLESVEMELFQAILSNNERARSAAWAETNATATRIQLLLMPMCDYHESAAKSAADAAVGFTSVAFYKKAFAAEFAAQGCYASPATHARELVRRASLFMAGVGFRTA